MEIVTLKNGSQEARTAVQVLLGIMRAMTTDGHFMLVYELVMFARDRDYQFFGKIGDDLVARNLLSKTQDGKYHIHDTTRNILLSAVTGEGLDMVIENPIAE